MNLPPFLKSVLTLSFGSILGQILGFAFLPFLSRLYSPLQYGNYSTFLGVCQVIILFSTLKYEKAIILPKSERKSNNIVLLAFFIVSIYALIATILIFIISSLNYTFKNLGNYIYLIPFSIIGFGFLSIINNWCQRNESYNLLSAFGVFQSLISIVISIFFGIYFIQINGLILGWISSSLIISIVFLLFNKKQIQKFYLNTSKKKLISIFNEFIKFPKYYLLYDFLSNGSIFIIPIVISYYFSPEECGLFSMAYRILMVPFIIISTSISNVFIVKANKEYIYKGSFNEIYLKTFNKVFIVGVIVYSIAFFWGGQITVVILGNKWKEIYSYIKILNTWLFFEFLVTVFKSNTYIIVQRQKLGLIIQFVNTILSFTSLILFSRLGIKIALTAFVISTSVFSVINLLLTYNLSKKIILE